MILWRIYTERKNVEDIIEYAQHLFPTNGLTFLNGVGLWQGSQEESLVIEYIGISDDETRITNLATSIRVYNKQESVLVTSQELLSHKLI